jgi:hypothetical protein
MSSLKTREDRKRVVIKARMRTDEGWDDVVIRNLSSRGVGLQSKRPPQRGNYVEIYRLDQRLIGRVAWSNGPDFGIVLRDRIAVESLVAGQSATDGSCGAGVERRMVARDHQRRTLTIDERAEQSQLLSKTINLVAIITTTLLAGFLLYDLASDTLTTPLKTVSDSLTRQT